MHAPVISQYIICKSSWKFCVCYNTLDPRIVKQPLGIQSEAKACSTRKLKQTSKKVSFYIVKLLRIKKCSHDKDIPIFCARIFLAPRSKYQCRESIIFLAVTVDRVCCTISPRIRDVCELMEGFICCSNGGGLSPGLSWGKGGQIMNPGQESRQGVTFGVQLRSPASYGFVSSKSYNTNHRHLSTPIRAYKLKLVFGLILNCKRNMVYIVKVFETAVGWIGVNYEIFCSIFMFEGLRHFDLC